MKNKKIIILVFIVLVALIIIGLAIKLIKREKIQKSTTNSAEEGTFSEVIDIAEEIGEKQEKNEVNNDLGITEEAEINEQEVIETNEEETNTQEQTKNTNTSTTSNTNNTTAKSTNDTNKTTTNQTTNVVNNITKENINNEVTTNVNTNTSTSQNETTTAERCTNNNNHGMDVGNVGEWFSTKDEAIATYKAETKKWGDLWTSYEIDTDEYNKNCPYRI